MIPIIKHIYHIIVIFGFLFEMPIWGFVTTRRISCIIAVISLLVNYKKLKAIYYIINKRNLVKVFFLFSVCTILTIIYSIGVVKDDSFTYFEPWFFLNFLIYVFLFALYCVVEFKNVKSFLFVYSICFIIQAVFVYWAVIDTNMRLILYDLFYFGDDRFEKTIVNGSRIMGINLCGADGSVVCSTSIVLLTYCYLKEYINILKYFLLSAVFLFMTLFIGRTGILIELLCIIYASLFRKDSNRILVFSVIFISVVLLGLILSETLSNTDSGEYLKKWMFSTFTSDAREGTLRGINRELPPFSSEFIVGSMVMVGKTSSGIIIDSDSGYIRLYASLGIIGSILFYTGVLCIYNVAKRRKNEYTINGFFLLLIVISYLIEYKEPFMLKYVFSYIILVVTLFSAKDSINEK